MIFLQKFCRYFCCTVRKHLDKQVFSLGSIASQKNGECYSEGSFHQTFIVGRMINGAFDCLLQMLLNKSNYKLYNLIKHRVTQIWHSYRQKLTWQMCQIFNVDVKIVHKFWKSQSWEHWFRNKAKVAIRYISYTNEKFPLCGTKAFFRKLVFEFALLIL